MSRYINIKGQLIEDNPKLNISIEKGFMGSKDNPSFVFTSNDSLEKYLKKEQGGCFFFKENVFNYNQNDKYLYYLEFYLQSSYRADDDVRFQTKFKANSYDDAKKIVQDFINNNHTKFIDKKIDDRKSTVKIHTIYGDI